MIEDIIPPQLNMLPENAVARIHGASLEVLNRVGVRVEDPVMREQLYGSGCVIEKERVKFPPDVHSGGLRRYLPFIHPDLSAGHSNRVGIR